jgi:hypothetical protein
MPSPSLAVMLSRGLARAAHALPRKQLPHAHGSIAHARNRPAARAAASPWPARQALLLLTTSSIFSLVASLSAPMSVRPCFALLSCSRCSNHRPRRAHGCRCHCAAPRSRPTRRTTAFVHILSLAKLACPSPPRRRR